MHRVRLKLATFKFENQVPFPWLICWFRNIPCGYILSVAKLSKHQSSVLWGTDKKRRPSPLPHSPQSEYCKGSNALVDQSSYLLFLYEAPKIYAISIWYGKTHLCSYTISLERKFHEKVTVQCSSSLSKQGKYRTKKYWKIYKCDEKEVYKEWSILDNKNVWKVVESLVSSKITTEVTSILKFKGIWHKVWNNLKIC